MVTPDESKALEAEIKLWKLFRSELKNKEDSLPFETYTVGTEHSITCKCGAITLHPPHIMSVTCPLCGVKLVRDKPYESREQHDHETFYCKCLICESHRYSESHRYK
jgi:hypothetical protein